MHVNVFVVRYQLNSVVARKLWESLRVGMNKILKSGIFKSQIASSGGSVTDRNLVRLFEILESCLGRKTLYTLGYFRILYFNYHEILFGIWNLCQKTVGFGISYRNLVGVQPLG